MKLNKRGTLRKNYKKEIIRKKKLTHTHKEWISSSKTYSSYPYLLTISFFRRNIFFNVSDFNGKTKYWTNAGRNNFFGKTKIAKLAVITMTENFIKKIWKYGIRCVIMKFNKRGTKRYPILKGIKRGLKNHPIKFVGILTKLDITFNGCRRKKTRRK